jgi:hypothetical protein
MIIPEDGYGKVLYWFKNKNLGHSSCALKAKNPHEQQHKNYATF